MGVITFPAVAALSFSLDTTSYTSADDVVASWSGGSGSGKDWVAICSDGVTPNRTNAEDWLYIGGTQQSKKRGPKSGSVTFTGLSLSQGTYSAYYLSNDSDTVLSGPINFTVSQAGGGNPAVSLSQDSYDVDESVTVNFTGGPGNDADWVGIYLPGQTPAQGTPSTLWAYTNGTQSTGGGVTSGSVTFNNPGLAEGNYVAYFLENNGYTVLDGPVAFSVDVAGGDSLYTDKSSYDVDETITVSYADGPGNSTDWIGIYYPGQTPAQGTTSLLWSYTSGTSGSVDFTNPGLQVGTYEAYFLANDGYTVIEGPISFSVVGSPGPARPEWVQSPFKRIHGVVGQSYTGLISAYASDPDLGDTLSYSLVSGPSWLSVAADGSLTGTPGSADVGANTFVVKATDLGGKNADATMHIEVFAAGAEVVTELKVLSFNLWHGLGKINFGHRKGVEAIILSGADLIGTQETVDNVSGTNAYQAKKIAELLGWHYSPAGAGDSGIISRYPITSEFTAGIANGIKVKLTSDAAQEVILYNCHLDYVYYGPYEAHLNGSTAQKVLTEEKKSQRDEEIATIISGMNNHLNHADTVPVLLTGDFNAPSHLDWTSATASWHGGVGYVAWPTSLACVNAGLLDSYRMVHPNPAIDPADTWSPLHGGSEPQDRIDFIYYKGNDLNATASEVFTTEVEVTVGAWGSDITPALNNTWPSDHSAVLTTFSVAP